MSVVFQSAPSLLDWLRESPEVLVMLKGPSQQAPLFADAVPLTVKADHRPEIKVTGEDDAEPRCRFTL